MTELVSITSGDLTARINPLGAELWSLTDRDGREYMTDADPAFWTGHAPLLFPIVGALNGGEYRIRGETYLLAKHGFARQSRFDCRETTDSLALFLLTDSQATRSVFPFAFSLYVSFQLSDWTLSMTATIINDDHETMPFSFGFHPAFAWPLPGGAAKETHRVTFSEKEPQPIRRIDPPSGLLLPDPQPTPVERNFLIPTANLFEPDALIWDNLASRSLNYGAPGGASLDIAFPNMPMLGIWQKPGANYLCIEPWHGIADPIGFDDDFRDKLGIVTLAPGQFREFFMDITVNPSRAPPSAAP